VTRLPWGCRIPWPARRDGQAEPWRCRKRCSPRAASRGGSGAEPPTSCLARQRKTSLAPNPILRGCGKDGPAIKSPRWRGRGSERAGGPRPSGRSEAAAHEEGGRAKVPSCDERARDRERGFAIVATCGTQLRGRALASSLERDAAPGAPALAPLRTALGGRSGRSLACARWRVQPEAVARGARSGGGRRPGVAARCGERGGRRVGTHKWCWAVST